MSFISNSWVTNAKKRKDALEYQKWFDNCKSLDDCVKNGFIDFTAKIFTPDLYRHIGNPKIKKCLEIGFGGGRILNAACKFFDFAYGVDIIDDECAKMSGEFIKRNGSTNFKLLNKKDISEIEEKSIDFLYSFIVFQHFDSFDEVDFYFNFIQRVLKNNGVVVIYFGRSDGKDIIVTKNNEFKDRECSLFLSKRFTTKYIEDNGFDIIESGEATKTPWSDQRSGQFYVKFKKR